MNEDKQSSDTKSVVEISNGSSGEFCTEPGPHIMHMTFFYFTSYCRDSYFCYYFNNLKLDCDSRI